MLRNPPFESFELTHRQCHRTAASAQPPPARRWRGVPALRAMCRALSEGLAASREYEQLRSSGIPHDAAISEALGFGRKPFAARWRHF
jgi:hypothetical protein